MGGGHSSKKAFTLIELLAIIVILAIIAVITVPIILNVIDNAKRGSVIDSAYGYKDAVQKFYVSKLYEDANFKFNDGTYTVGTLKTMGVSVDGTSPTDDSWVQITNNQVVDYSLKFDEWVVNYNNNNPETIKNGTLKSQPSVISWILPDDEAKSVSYYEASWVKNKGIVKFDPTAGTSGEVCTTGDTCYTWYKFGEYTESGTKYVKMVMGSNLVSSTTWTNRNTALQNAITVEGEVTWKVEPKIITAQEVANITGAARTTEDGGIGWNASTATTSNWFYFNSNYSQTTSGTGNTVNTDYSPWLYSSYNLWTDTAVGSGAWQVDYHGYLCRYRTSGTGALRPVITVPASVLES